MSYSKWEPDKPTHGPARKAKKKAKKKKANGKAKGTGLLDKTKGKLGL